MDYDHFLLFDYSPIGLKWRMHSPECVIRDTKAGFRVHDKCAFMRAESTHHSAFGIFFGGGFQVLSGLPAFLFNQRARTKSRSLRRLR